MPTGTMHSFIRLFAQQYQNTRDFGILKYSDEWQKRALIYQGSEGKRGKWRLAFSL